jgi:hypothetical protein
LSVSHFYGSARHLALYVDLPLVNQQTLPAGVYCTDYRVQV